MHALIDELFDALREVRRDWRAFACQVTSCKLEGRGEEMGWEEREGKGERGGKGGVGRGDEEASMRTRRVYEGREDDERRFEVKYRISLVS